MTKDAAERIYSMIYKEICRYSLMDLCESWGVSEDDVDEFMDAALRAVINVEEKSDE